MDPIERAAIGDPASPAVSGESVASEPAKTVEPTQQTAQSAEPAENADFLATPLSDPNLEAQRLRLVETERHMIANNTRKTKEREEQFRRETDALTAERQQTAAMMAQATQQQQAATPQESGPTGIAAQLSPAMQQQVAANPELQEMFAAIDRTQGSQLKTAEEQNATLLEKMTALETSVQQQQQQVFVDKMRPQAEALNAKYGQSLTPEIGMELAKKSTETGMSLEDALLATSPDIVRNQMLAAARTVVEAENKERYGDLGALAGMDDEILGQPPTETHQPGESMIATARRNLGPRGFADAMREEPDD